MIEKMPFYIQQIYALIIPIYRSVLAIQDNQLQKPLLTYWVIYGFFLVIEKILPFIIYIPFYMVFKFYLLIWLIQSGGSVFIYKKFIQKYAEQVICVVEDPEQLNQALQRGKTIAIDVSAQFADQVITPMFAKTPLGRKFSKFQ